MKRINQYLFYRMATVIHPLSELREGVPVAQVAPVLFGARTWLQYLLDAKMFQLVVCKSSIQRLIEAISSVIPKNWTDLGSIDSSETLDASRHYAITHALNEFETVLGSELPTIDTYVVSKKGIYSTADLIDRAEMAIDDESRRYLRDQVVADFKQAGKCLAFELPTASGFHVMRAVESVLRDYWTLVKKPPEGTRPPEMAQCINELRSEGEDVKLLDILDHIRDLHRNTIMHPEAFLTPTEAMRLFDIAKSAISGMAGRIGELTPEPDLAELFEAMESQKAEDAEDA